MGRVKWRRDTDGSFDKGGGKEAFVFARSRVSGARSAVSLVEMILGHFRFVRPAILVAFLVSRNTASGDELPTTTFLLPYPHDLLRAAALSTFPSILLPPHRANLPTYLTTPRLLPPHQIQIQTLPLSLPPILFLLTFLPSNRHSHLPTQFSSTSNHARLLPTSA